MFIQDWFNQDPSVAEAKDFPLSNFAKLALGANPMITRWFDSAYSANISANRRIVEFDLWSVRVSWLAEEVFFADAVAEYADALIWYDDKPVGVSNLDLAWAIITDLGLLASPNVSEDAKLKLLAKIGASGYQLLYGAISLMAFPSTSKHRQLAALVLV